MNDHRNLAARMAHWSAQHRKPAIFGWLAFAILAFAIGNMVGSKPISDVDQFSGESHDAEAVLDRAGLRPTAEVVFLQSNKLTIKDPEFQAAITDVTRRLQEVPYVENVKSPLAGAGSVSEDGHTALVDFEIAGDSVETKKRVDPVLATVARIQSDHPNLDVEQFGAASANKAINETISEDLKSAGLLSIPITLIILTITFGTLVAAGVPLLIGITSVIAAMGLIALPSSILPVDDNLPAVILLIGLAVGVDYSLFYLKREREERAAGRSESAALEAAAATSGRAVLISGITVIVAMAGMLISGDKAFISFAEGTILVVAMAMFASLTVLPAMLSWLGDRVEKGRVPILGRRRRPAGQSRFWSSLTGRVMRRPGIALVLAGGLLVALSLPALGLKSVTSDIDELPQDLPVIVTYNKVKDIFPAEGVTTTVVVEADDVRSGAVAAGIDRLVADVNRSDTFRNGTEVSYSDDGTVAKIDVPSPGKRHRPRVVEGPERDPRRRHPGDGRRGGRHLGERDRRRGQLRRLQQQSEEQTAADLRLRVRARFPAVAGHVPVDRHSDHRNRPELLSVGAAYGLLVLVFQNGNGESVLGFTSNGGVTNWLPLFLFVVLFGLSMDYHVFILSRIKELYDRGTSTDEAVKQGIATTAGTVTSAALVMVGVFAVFITLTFIDFKELGFGLAAAVLIDATIIRGVLLPASMKLLGDSNWYLPRWLEWLPQIGSEQEVAPPPERTKPRESDEPSTEEPPARPVPA